MPLKKGIRLALSLSLKQEKKQYKTISTEEILKMLAPFCGHS